MDEEMEDRNNDIEFTFTAVEIDLDYEFDAARYFDFSKEESIEDASEAEMWFQSAATYPPSPFVTKLVLREDILLENVNTSPKLKGLENMNLTDSDSHIGLGSEFSAMDASNRGYEVMDVGISTDVKNSNLQKIQTQPRCLLTGYEGMAGGTSTDLKDFHLKKLLNQTHHLPSGLTFYNHIRNDKSEAKTKSIMKSSFSRTSTLMKPTASQLAKQNRPRLLGDSRFQKLENNDKSLNNSSGIESQAAKRQKIEGGQLRKVADTNQQHNLVHKAPKKDGTIDGYSENARLRLTIPREPDLETTHRAQRMRPNISRERETVIPTARTFRARPLNRKILEAPSLLLPKRSTPRVPEFQEFHLKTSERAMQHHSAVSSSSVHCNNSKMLPKSGAVAIADCRNRESTRPNTVDDLKQVGCEVTHKFKALPLNKKIFSSKGDIGVFRNSKRETTVPMEFNFHTEKRVQQGPPVELFNKLSLTSEVQPNAGSQIKLSRPASMLPKGSKENRFGSFQQESEIKHLLKGKKPPTSGLKHIQCGSDEGITEVGPLSSISSRSLGIR